MLHYSMSFAIWICSFFFFYTKQNLNQASGKWMQLHKGRWILASQGRNWKPNKLESLNEWESISHPLPAVPYCWTFLRANSFRCELIRICEYQEVKKKNFLEYLLKGVRPEELGEGHVLWCSIVVLCRIKSPVHIFMVLRAGMNISSSSWLK